MLPALAGALLLAACATPFEVSDVNTIKATATPSGGTAFSRALFDEYKVYAKQEAEVEYEWDDAAIFARKGLAIVQGTNVMPENVADWSMPAARATELNGVRARLMGYFDGGARERVPAIAAKAQAKFDCWVEEEHEGDADSSCRKDFLALEPQLKPQPVVAAPPTPKIVKTFIVYFDFNKADITAQAAKTLKEVAAAQAEIKPLNIFVSGHTDTVGTSTYNKKLSDKRAAAVTSDLAKLGVKASVFDVKTYGKDKLAVATGDNVKEPKNRRVEIYFEK
jgi:outer membrane protein OmpA-like peptidoglycan-associated protein